MRIFISHSTKNQEMVLRFAELLENVCDQIEVFCSSATRSIMVGENFVKKIFCELDTCDMFIPILSREYYQSRFCMIELGVAYSYLLQKYESNGEQYIFPFALYPVTKGQALAGTPMSNIEVGDLDSGTDIKSLFDYMSNKHEIRFGSGVNRIIHSFQTDLENVLLKERNILDLAKIGGYFDDSIIYHWVEDVIRYKVVDGAIVVNYNMNPYKGVNIKRPNFISLALRFPDKLDMRKYLDFNAQAELRFCLVNSNASLHKISVEFKYSDVNSILDTVEFPAHSGESTVSIPLVNMRGEALSRISEICFVIHPCDVSVDEGMFLIKEIEIA